VARKVSSYQIILKKIVLNPKPIKPARLDFFVELQYPSSTIILSVVIKYFCASPTLWRQ